MYQRNLFLTFLLRFTCLTCFGIGSTTVFGQRDSLVMKNGDILVGEIKNMTKGVLTLETVYSDKDFAVEWVNVREAYARSRFLLLLSDGRRITGRFFTDNENNRMVIMDQDGAADYVSLDDLVYIKALKSNFWGRSSANIDVGFNLAKANNLKQYTANVKLGYLADAWQIDMAYSQLYAIQDSIDANRRTDASINGRYFLERDWFLAGSISFLSNTEQALKLRSSGAVGGGKFLNRSNKAYWAVGAGLSFNHETFFNSTPTRKSIELYAGTELNLFDIGDLNFYLKPAVYYSLTEAGRWRMDLKSDLKYDLPKDFYIKTNLTLNYDNRPAELGNTTDYVWAVTFGWEL
jgi:hypothetical protein